jgi:two-component system, sensor histidine kinase and response regulator
MPRRKRRLSIRAQVLGSVLVAVTLVAGALLAFFAQRQRTQATQALEARVAGTADMLSVGVALGLRSADFTGISRAMSWARRDPAILWAVVVDSTNLTLAHYAVPGRQAPAPRAGAPLGRVVREADILTIAVAVVDGDDQLGRLHLGVSMSAAEASIRKDQQGALIMVLGISLLATLFGVVVSRRISRPIEELRDAAVNVGDGAVPSFPEQGSTETAELGRAFRAMAVRIRETLGALTTQATELADSRDAALGATQAKSLFLATMSHELRTPMTGVLGMLDLLMRTSLSGKQQTFARTARDSAESLLVLIDDILDFSKIEAGKLTLEAVPFDPRAIAEDVAALLAERAHRKQLSLICDVASDVPASVIGDPTRIRQILLNLGGNAVKFTSSGEVRIEVRVESVTPQGTVVRFAVHDSGLGMSDEARSRLFSAFTQAEASTTRRFGGTGLGLSICRGLVELTGGRIEVQSTLGQGSVFTVHLPFVVAIGAPAATTPLAGRRMLLIHRPGTQRAVVANYLREAGADVATCDGLERCAEATHTAQPDVVLLEVAHSASAVAEQVARLRRVNGMSSTRILLLATLDSPVLLDDQHVATTTISLPVRRQTLLDAVCDTSAAPTATPARAADVVPVATGLRILVAEDHPVNREIAQYMLRELGHEVLLAENGQDALGLLDREPVDLVLMDCQMPVLDGFAATRELRRREQGLRRLPVVALTANAVKGDREACLAAGMDDYLSKPYTRAQLAVICERWLRNSPVFTPVQQPPTSVADSARTLVRRLQDQLGETDDAFARDLLGRFLQITDDIVDDMRTAVRGEDRVAIQQLAHRLRGSSATVCADDVANAARTLERLPSSADIATVAARLVDVEAEVDRLREVIGAA